MHQWCLIWKQCCLYPRLVIEGCKSVCDSIWDTIGIAPRSHILQNFWDIKLTSWLKLQFIVSTSLQTLPILCNQVCRLCPFCAIKSTDFAHFVQSSLQTLPILCNQVYRLCPFCAIKSADFAHFVQYPTVTKSAATWAVHLINNVSLRYIISIIIYADICLINVKMLVSTQISYNCILIASHSVSVMMCF